MSWVPFEEIIRGEINDSLYAADLWAVHTGRAPPRYLDPNKFFERTHFTTSLKELLTNAVRRLEGDSNAAPVSLLLTGLGGGKTHALIALYHLAKNAKLLSKATRDLLASEGVPVPSTEASVVVFDGVALDPKRVEERYGGRHLWSYIFGELGAAEVAERYRDVAPGSEVIYEVLSAVERERPVVILMDETLNYLENLPGKEKDVMFMHHLSKAFVQLKRSLLVVTLIDSKGGREIAEGLVANVQKVAKSGSVITPSELPAVVRRALLRHVSGAEEAAGELYRRYSENADVFAQRYTKEALAAYYPIHPSTVSLLSELAESGAIQSTRDVLRILAWTLHSVYNEGRGGVYIVPGDIPIERGEVKTLVFKDEKLRLAVEQDLADIEVLEKAAQGRDCGRFFRRLYRAVALASAAGRYPTEREVALYAYSHDIGAVPSVLHTCLKDLVGRVTHLHYFTKGEEGRYAVKSKAFWKALVKKKVEEVLRSDGSKYYERLKKLLQGMNITRVSGFEKAVWTIPEDRPRPVLVLADPRWPSPAEAVEKSRDGRPRVMKGAVVVLKADREKAEEAVRILAEIDAAKRIKDEAKEYGLEEADVQSLDKFIQEREAYVRGLAARDLYTALVYASRSGGVTELAVSLRLDEDPESIREKIEKALADDGKLARSVSPQLVRQLVERLYESFKTPPKFSELVEHFSGKSPDYPLLLNAQEVLKAVVRSSPDLVVVRGGEVVEKPEYIGGEDLVATVEMAERLGFKRGQRAEAEARRAPEAQAVQKPSRREISSVRELVQALKEAAGSRVRVVLSGETEDPQHVEDLPSFLELYADKTAEVGGRVERLHIAISAVVEGGEAARFEYEVRRAQRDLVKKALDGAKSAVKSLHSVAKLRLRYRMEASGDAAKLAEKLDTPLIVEKYKPLKIQADLEKLV
jgi:hypothetical protein